MLRGVIRLFEHTFALVRIFLLISLICFMPRFFVTYHKEGAPLLLRAEATGRFTLGLENIQKDFVARICPEKEIINIGLVTHERATDHQGTRNLELLQQKGLTINKVFYAQNGFYTDEPCVLEQPVCADEIARYRLYKQGFSDAMLEHVDLLLVDLPDMGIGYMHAISILFESLQVAAVHRLPIIILDRPNLLGQKIEGSLCCVSHLPIKLPLRYGMTMAELAQYYNTHVLHGAAPMHIVPMHDYHRAQAVPVHATLLPHVNQLHAAYGFSICGILAQVAPFDVGLDTDYPYSCIMVPQSVQFPEQRWYQLQVMLRQLGIKSSFCRHFSTRKNELCRGLRFHIDDVDQVDSFKVVLVVLEFFKRCGVMLAFSDYFDAAVGTPLVRQYCQGAISKKMLTKSVNNDLESFYRKAFGAFMYHPLPQVSLIC